jgi:hypothetical protein
VVARDDHLRRAQHAVAEREARARDLEHRAVGHRVGVAHRDDLVALGVERLARLAEPTHAVARERGLELPRQRAHAAVERLVGRRQSQRALDAVDRLQPVAQQRLARLADAPLDLALGALAVVVEVGERALAALLELRVALAQLAHLVDRGLLAGGGARARVGLTRV